MEEKVKKVDSTTIEIQTQVQDLQIKIKPETPPKEKKRREKVNEALVTLQQLNVVESYCTIW